MDDIRRGATWSGSGAGRIIGTEPAAVPSPAIDDELPGDPLRDKVHSLAEVDAIEGAYRQGVPSLGHAAAALLARWRLPLRDGETFIRLAFLSWYAEHRAAHLTGLDRELPSVDDLVADRGGDDALSAEERFILAILWSVFPPLSADDDVRRARALRRAEAAAALEPASRLFREWRFLMDETDDTLGPRIYVEPEVHARFHGRGAMGEYLVHTLMHRLRETRFPAPPR